MTTPKVFVTSNMEATFSCSKCGKTEQKDVSKFMGHKTQVKLKYKCKCQNSFSVILERRRSVRKNVRLKGSLIFQEKTYPITTADLSKHGIKIRLLNQPPLELEDIVTVELTLDDPGKSVVTKDVKIKKLTSDAGIGCEFLSPDHYDAFGKYFLFHF